ncbi:Protein of unknown function [Gryllus bimaculatus]|nr:Protein of unknown function [Gryllus bimaculatus]
MVDDNDNSMDVEVFNKERGDPEDDNEFRDLEDDDEKKATTTTVMKKKTTCEERRQHVKSRGRRDVGRRVNVIVRPFAVAGNHVKKGTESTEGNDYLRTASTFARTTG